MRQTNKIMKLLVALFFAISLVVFLSYDSIKGIFGASELRPGLVVTFLVIGAVLFFISWGTDSMVHKNLDEELVKKEKEKNDLKARLYDLEQEAKLSSLDRQIKQSDVEKDPKTIRPRQNFK